MFNDDNCVAGGHKSLQNCDEFGNVVGVKACCGFVQDVQRFACGALGKFRCKLNTLRFATGQGCCRLAKFDVAKAHVVQRLNFVFDRRDVFEKANCLFYRHIQYVGNGLTFVLDSQRFAVVARAMTNFARNVHVRQKVHRDAQNTVTRAMLTTATANVEGKSAGFVATLFGISCGCEQVADGGKHACVGCGVTAGCASNGALVDGNYFVQKFDAFDTITKHIVWARSVEFFRKDRQKHFVHQGRFATTGHTCYHVETSKWETNVDVV